MDLSRISLILGLFLTIANVSNWTIKYFNGAYKLKKNKEVLNEDVTKSKTDISEIKIQIHNVTDMIDKLFEINKIQTRYIIVNACTEAIENGHIEQYELQSLEDMYSMYTDVLHGNSYVTTLMKKLRRLEIRNGE